MVQEFIHHSKSRWGGELPSLRRDVAADPHGRDSRILCIFLGEFHTRNMRVMVFDISAMGKNEPSLRINAFNAEGSPCDNGVTLDFLSIKGDMGILLWPPETIPIVWKKWETVLADYMFYYTVTGWRERTGCHLNEQQLRPMPCKLC